MTVKEERLTMRVKFKSLLHLKSTVNSITFFQYLKSLYNLANKLPGHLWTIKFRHMSRDFHFHLLTNVNENTNQYSCQNYTNWNQSGQTEFRGKKKKKINESLLFKKKTNISKCHVLLERQMSYPFSIFMLIPDKQPNISS